MQQAFSIAFHAVVPLFLFITVGYVTKRVGWLDDHDVCRFNKVAFRTFMPIMLFYSIYTSDFSSAVQPTFILFGTGMAVCLFLLSLLITVLTVKAPEQRGVMIQAAFRSNFVLLGFPIARVLLPGGNFAVTAVMMSIIIPLYNSLSVIVLEAFRGTRAKAKEILLSLIKNPMIIAAILGVLTVLLDIELPFVLFSFAEEMDAAATPVLLLLAGASFQGEELIVYKKELSICVGLRLLIFPAIGLTFAALLGFRGVEFVTLLALFSAPTAVTSFNMAQELGGDYHLAGCAVVASTTLSFFTLVFWITLSKSMGMF